MINLWIDKLDVRFADFRSMEDQFNWLSYPFTVNIETAPNALQYESIRSTSK